jgi:glutaconyl-CoA/methylmalonyl-CoA decarboxylase subunit gamma
MRYFVTVDGAERVVDLVAQPDGGFAAQCDGERSSAQATRLPGGILIRVGQRVYDLTIDGKLPDLGVASTGVRTRVSVHSERARATSAAGPSVAAANLGALVAPMPGRIVKVLVQQGDCVVQDAPVVVVEAMKMENELRAPRAGTIMRVSVRSGDRVEAGTILLQID